MICPLCGQCTTQPGWWCNLFLGYFPKIRLDIAELAYHLKVEHKTYFRCPCGLSGEQPVTPDTVINTDPASLKDHLESLCEHFMKLDDVDVHLQYHMLAKKPEAL